MREFRCTPSRAGQQSMPTLFSVQCNQGSSDPISLARTLSLPWMSLPRECPVSLHPQLPACWGGVFQAQASVYLHIGELFSGLMLLLPAFLHCGYRPDQNCSSWIMEPDSLECLSSKPISIQVKPKARAWKKLHVLNVKTSRIN